MRKTLLLLLGIIFSLAVIGGVFFLVREQQAPTPTPRPTPVSTPTPSEEPVQVFELDTPDRCQVTFVVPTPGTPTLNCVSKVAWENEVTNTPTNYNLVTQTDSFVPGDIIVYEIKYSSSLLESATIVDELDANVVFMDSESGCSIDPVANEVTCEVDLSSDPSGSVLYRVETDGDLVDATSIANLATISETTEGLSDTCSSTITYTPGSSPTPTPTPSQSASPTPTPSITPTPSSPVLASPTPSTLPEAGIMELTTGTLGIGLILLVIGLAGLLLI